eukprot:CAMPEP_0167810326 /NCGR_PEP_ID=MMETSP0112_2-20121227/19_1 /TAXON_ID=91324 /ORGANISM="Lotharella globosa, Strain CCCM811" /LENGTH=848 /DNA_ID=CAMNT_0007708851 /DNA_START=102 /DNA_END=2648 /DNA_ORIENTATION=-
MEREIKSLRMEVRRLRVENTSLQLEKTSLLTELSATKELLRGYGVGSSRHESHNSLASLASQDSAEKEGQRQAEMASKAKDRTGEPLARTHVEIIEGNHLAAGRDILSRKKRPPVISEDVMKKIAETRYPNTQRVKRAYSEVLECVAGGMLPYIQSSRDSPRYGDASGFVVDSREVTVLHKLWEGKFATTHKALVNTGTTPRSVAIKIQRPRINAKEYKKEMQLLMRASGQLNIMGLVGVAVSDKGDVGFLTELCELGSLDEIHGSHDLTKPKAFWRIVRGLFLALAHLQARSMVHRDVACRNILLNHKLVPKLTGFRYARRVGDGSVSASASVRIGSDEDLTWGWLAPESLREERFTHKSDTWAAGVTVWEILHRGKEPYSDVKAEGRLYVQDKIRMIKDGRLRLQFNSKELSPEQATKYSKLLSACLTFDPIQRPDAYDILETLVPGGPDALDCDGSPEIKAECKRRHRGRRAEVHRKFEEGYDFYVGSNWKRRSQTTAKFLISQAVLLGSLAAQGFCFQEGICGHKADRQKAINLYEKASASDERAALTLLGEALFNEEAHQSHANEEALSLFTAAAALGHPAAHRGLGKWHETVGMDYEAATEWYRTAATQGDSAAQYRLGVCYFEGIGVAKDEKEAVNWFRMAAEQGNVDAQCNLGDFYFNGLGVAPDENKAFEWYLKAAAQGDACGQCGLGFYYSNGRGVGKDEKQAAEWYRRAAEQGDADAQFRLGCCYDNGLGVGRDEKEAAAWYLKAAKQGDPRAEFSAGLCYERGSGVAKDRAKAIEWYRKAADQGDNIAQRNLQALVQQEGQQEGASSRPRKTWPPRGDNEYESEMREETSESDVII